MRIYMPKPEVRSGVWKEPPMQVAAAQMAPAMQATLSAPATPSSTSSVLTPIGTIPLSFGLPADQATRQKLYDELDFQRASQAYIWGLPIVSFAQWQHSARTKPTGSPRPTTPPHHTQASIPDLLDDSGH